MLNTPTNFSYAIYLSHYNGMSSMVRKYGLTTTTTKANFFLCHDSALNLSGDH